MWVGIGWEGKKAKEGVDEQKSNADPNYLNLAIRR